ncbi:MAG: GNAT family N-acetyltransferase [Armatimonadota bacterium]|nr:GNAT family N-acetyltransferase [Armatimonadota bacterium]MDR7548997.1 GNAT family N-acetyltransferase [Armatimonadota bacterium]
MGSAPPMLASPPEITVRPYRAGDEEGVLALLREVLGAGRAFDRSVAFWRWKHFETPFGPSLLLVAVNERIVGLRAFMRWKFCHGGRTLTAVRAVDTATHPDFRGFGVFTRLTRLAVEHARSEGVDLIFNTPNPISRAGYLKMGWTYVGKPRLLVKVLRPLRVARSLAARGDVADGDGPALRAPIAPVQALVSGDLDLEGLLREDDRLAGGRLRTPRTTAFLQWRYGAASGLPYYACWRHAPTPAAAVVLRPNRRRGLREVVLCELLIQSAMVDEAVALLHDVADVVDADYLVAHAARRTVQAQALVRAGFIPLPGMGPALTVRPLSPAASEVAATRLSAWHFSLGDLEVF